MVSTPVIYAITWISTHVPISEGWKADLAWLVDPQQTLYTRSGHMSTINQAYNRESPLAKDWRPNHWATLPTSVRICVVHYCTAGTQWRRLKAKASNGPVLLWLRHGRCLAMSTHARWRSWIAVCPDFTLQMMMRSSGWKLWNEWVWFNIPWHTAGHFGDKEV